MAGEKGRRASAAAHRECQRRYRERLKETRDPESDDVQRATFAVLRDLTFDVRVGQLEGDEQHLASIRAFLLDLYEQTLHRLCRDGFSRKKAKRRLSLALKPPYPRNGDDALTQ